MPYSAKEIEKIGHWNPSEIAIFITLLLSKIDKLETRVKELERQTGLTSASSSNPPSSEPRSTRKAGGKIGAPKDHDGHTLEMIDEPDEIEWHQVQSCSHCAAHKQAFFPENVKAPVQYGAAGLLGALL